MRTALSPLLLLAAGALLPSCGDGQARPNVLLVTLDTTRPDRMSVYGGKAQVPTLERIAGEGVRFERCVSTAGITPMSHAAILSGLNNYSHGLRVFHSDKAGFQLPDSVETLPEKLKAAGYRTGARVSSYPVSTNKKLDQGFEDFSTGGVEAEDLDLSHQQKHETQFDQSGVTSTQRRGDRTVDEALAWLEKGGDQPWMLWVHMFDVHDTSVVPPAEFAAARGITYPSPDEPIRGMASHQWRDRMYDPELEWMDAQLARVADYLDRTGQWDNTVVVVTADHGQGLLDGLERHGWVKHRLLYDWSIRVPLLVRAPGMPQGEVVSKQVRTIDIVPTILQLCDLPGSPVLEGASVVDLWQGAEESQPRVAYADALNLYDDHSPRAKALPPGQYDNLYVATDGEWKFVWHEREPENSELYHLTEDPGEVNNLYAAQKDSEAAVRLRKWLEARNPQEVRPQEETSGPSGAALNQLGYGGDEE
ncbi:MAG: sulfatase [Planctomycetota bacterium]|nr:sulfatase [Planctomycetota bacterium]